MLRISKLTDYAILVMVELGAANGEIVSAQCLSERAHIELPTTSKVLKLLARAGLIRSFRGVNGGYSLDRQPGEVSVAEIISAIEGPIAMTECSVKAGLCSQEAMCSLRSNWRRISHAVAQAMADVTLDQMSRPIRSGNAALQIATLNS